MTIWIDNQEVKGLGEEFISTDPVNQQMLWQGNAAISKQVKEAITSARLAFFSWKSTPFVERQALVMRFKAELLEQSEHIAIAIAKETGKPLWESRTEVSAMIGKIAISIEAYHERTGNKEKTIANGKLILRHHPLGVMAVLGPYNFPAHLPNGHIIPALLAGNTIVLKPSELTPWVSELIMKIWIKSGLPKGVINLVQGGREVGESLVEDDDINAVLFTGSAKVGSLIHKRLAGKPEKMLALEMGGNNPLIISEHYGSLYSAVNIIVQSAFISAGQRCTCARRVFIPSSLQGDLLLEKLIKVTSKLKIGGQFDEPAAFFGALISQQAAEKMMAAQVSLLSLGGKALLDAKLIKHAMVTPAIIDVSAIEKLPDEEYFAPLLQVIRYQNLDQAIAMANDTKFGLSAGLISTQDEEWAQFLEKIQAGVVNRNCPLTGASSELPFGGVGLSGNLRPSAYYAADYCAYPVASMQGDLPLLPTNLSPGIVLD